MEIESEMLDIQLLFLLSIDSSNAEINYVLIASTFKKVVSYVWPSLL